MVKSRLLFMYSFAFVVVIRAITLCEFRDIVPYTAVYIMYMAFWLLMMIKEGKLTLRTRSSQTLRVVLFLLAYDVIFAFLNISALDTKDVLTNLAHSAMMIVFVYVSAFWIIKFDCFKQIIKTTYCFFAVFMTTLFVIYIRNAQIMETISTFWNQFGSMRKRELFGFIANNVAAEHAFSVILLSLYYMHEYPSRNKTLRNMFILLDDIMMFIMIVANNSRGTLVTAIMMVGVYWIAKSVKKNGIKKVLKYSALGLTLIIAALVYYLQITGKTLIEVLYFTNRMHFIANYNILVKSGRWLTGIGRTTGSFLAGHNYIYGMQTDYMEVYYVGVFIQTGIIGLIWIMSSIYIIGKDVYKKYKRERTYEAKWIFTVFFYSMVLSIFEDYILSSLYITSVFFLTFIISYCSKKEKTKIDILMVG